jgi:hypothetical protein
MTSKSHSIAFSGFFVCVCVSTGRLNRSRSREWVALPQPQIPNTPPHPSQGLKLQHPSGNPHVLTAGTST